MHAIFTLGLLILELAAFTCAFVEAYPKAKMPWWAIVAVSSLILIHPLWPLFWPMGVLLACIGVAALLGAESAYAA